MKDTHALLTLFVVALFAAGGYALYHFRETPEEKKPEMIPPAVRTVTARSRDLTLTVKVHGAVVPRTEVTLAPEVPGRVIEVASSFERGGFFEPGEILVRLDPADYELALAAAEAGVAQARVRVAREEAEAEIARQEWETYGEGTPDPLVLREPQLAEAGAALASAKSGVDRARLNLDRTGIRAPFSGRVRTKQADVGQYVSPGTPLARIYAVDYVEARLPISLEDLRHLDLPLDYRGEERPEEGPGVILRASIGGAEHEWRGRIVRTEAEIDERTRMIHAVARVEDPYARGAEAGRPPLMVGLFVEAEVAGREARGAVVLPRDVVRPDSTVWTVDGGDRLRLREVGVLRLQGNEAVIGSGLPEGERVCLRAPLGATEGMRVTPIGGSDE